MKNLLQHFLSPFLPVKRYTNKTHPSHHDCRSLLIIGLGKVGMSCAEWFAGKKVPFAIYDDHLTKEKYQKILSFSQIPSSKSNSNSLNHTNCLRESWDKSKEAELIAIFKDTNDLRYTDIILSPGIPRYHSLVQIAIQQGITVWNDIDFFYPLINNKILIGVTGTDGKTTTVELFRHVLNAHVNTISCGNNGTAITSVLDEIMKPATKVVVIEFSSYMLEVVYRYRSSFSVILNIAADHLDRYNNIHDYQQAKKNLLLHTTDKDIYLRNMDNPNIAGFIPPRVSVLSYTNQFQQDSPTHRYAINTIDYWVKNSITYFERKYLSNSSSPQSTQTPEDHKLFTLPRILKAVLLPHNILPVLVIARKLKIPSKAIKKQIMSFAGIPHRLEKIPNATNSRGENIHAFNNSKATTLQSVLVSLEYLFQNFNKPVYLILGGKSKNISFLELSELKDKIHTIYFYGESGDTIRNEIRTVGFNGIYHYDFNTVVKTALKEIPINEILILSPGCASFDQFENYEQRGEKFKQLVSPFILENKTKT